MTNAEINLNAAECIVRKSAIGHDVVTNICSGTETIVPWQAVDWLGAMLAVGVALLFGMLFIGLTWMIFVMVREGI